jgi:hypothetical protein
MLRKILVVLVVVEASALANPEVLTDRCSGEVAFTLSHDGKPTDPGTVILKRTKSGNSPFMAVTVKPDKDGYIRWWCHSTTGNVFDPGTWRVHVDNKQLGACLLSIDEALVTDGMSGSPKCQKVVKISSSAFDGWTPERSRCANHGGKLKARLGANRLLQTECLGK